MRWLAMMVLLHGCFEPPEFPLLDEIPIEPHAETCAPARSAQVICALDGDTFDIGMCGENVLGERIRLLGVDAPEIAKTAGGTSECFGEEAAEELADLLVGQRVILTFDAECIGAFDRTLAYVWLADDALEDAWKGRDLSPVLDRISVSDEEGSAVMLNEWLLWSGFARLYPEEIAGTLIYQARLDSSEGSARSRGEGLWRHCDVTEPTSGVP